MPNRWSQSSSFRSLLCSDGQELVLTLLIPPELKYAQLEVHLQAPSESCFLQLSSHKSWTFDFKRKLRFQSSPAFRRSSWFYSWLNWNEIRIKYVSNLIGACTQLMTLTLAKICYQNFLQFKAFYLISFCYASFNELRNEICKSEMKSFICDACSFWIGLTLILLMSLNNFTAFCLSYGTILIGLDFCKIVKIIVSSLSYDGSSYASSSSQS